MDISKIQTLLRDYIIEEELSSGSFSTVFKATCLRTSRKLALKVINTEKHSRSSLRLILQEAKILENVRHPNVVRLYREFQTEHLRVLEFELLQITLQELIASRLKNDNGLSQEECKIIITAILNGLKYLESKNIIHRDLKPENIGFADASNLNSLKIIDFGLSTKVVVQDLQMISDSVGTIVYMAPEIFLHTEYNGVNLKGGRLVVFGSYSLFYFKQRTTSV